MRAPKVRQVLIVSMVLTIWAGVIYVVGANLKWWPTVNGPNWFEPQIVTDPHAKSDNLEADIEKMWETEVSEYGTTVSTNDAIDAANRVFNTVDLVGLTGAQVIEKLGSPSKSHDSIYRSSPFWPVQSRALVYRIENGSYGIQVNVYCHGDDQPVTGVEKLWIH